MTAHGNGGAAPISELLNSLQHANNVPGMNSNGGTASISELIKSLQYANDVMGAKAAECRKLQDASFELLSKAVRANAQLQAQNTLLKGMAHMQAADGPNLRAPRVPGPFTIGTESEDEIRLRFHRLVQIMVDMQDLPTSPQTNGASGSFASSEAMEDSEWEVCD